MENPRPTYGINQPQFDAFSPVQKPSSFLEEAGANWQLSFTPQVVQDVANQFYEDEEGYNPWDNFSGYEMFADRLVHARSPGQMDAMKRQIDRNMKSRETIARGEWGLIAGLVGGVLDPVNLIPVPGVAGVGFVRGAIKAGASNIAITAATEPLRIGADATADWSEMQYSLGAAGLIGAGLGGLAGSFRGSGVRARNAGRPAATMEDLWKAASADDGENIATSFNADAEEVAREMGKTNSYDEAGRYQPISFEDVETPVRTKEGADGQTYVYDDQLGWQNRNSPETPLSDDVRDALGVPDRVLQERMIVDDTTLKHEYERGKWIDSLPEEMRATADRIIRNADEYLTFKQLEAVWGKRLSRMDGEAPEAFKSRVLNLAVNEVQARRIPATVARTNALTPYLDLANRSPTAQGVRMFPTDNVLTDLPLQIAGDGGWMTQNALAGVGSTPSVFIATIRHLEPVSRMRETLDAGWLKFVTKNKDVKGVTFAGQNMSAAFSGIQANIKSRFGSNVLTPQDFRNMVGRAIFENDDFEVNGFAVVPEAREAAKIISKTFEEYDVIQRELGLFKDQQSLKRTIQQADQRLLPLRDKMARFLWAGKETPGAMKAAIRIDQRVFTGETHAEAINSILDQFGADGRAMIEKLTPEDYGWSVADAAKAPDAPFGGVPLTTRLKDSNGDPLPLNHGTTAWFSRFSKEMRGKNTGDRDAFSGVFFATNPALAEAAPFGGGESGRVIKAYADAADPVEYLPSEYGGFFESQRWKDLIEDARREGNDAVIFKDFEWDGGKTDIVVMLDEQNIYVDGQSFVGLTAKEAKFRDFNATIKGRVESLSDNQRAVYNDMDGQLQRLEAERLEAETALQSTVDTPHTFSDQKGRQEGYFARWYNENAIEANRPQFVRLVTSIFAKDNPLGAAERAESFVDDMLGITDMADDGPPLGAGPRHLNERKIKVGNSYKITDPEFGEIRLSDFIETDVEVIVDTYIRRAGARIEMARVFGDADMWAKLHDIEAHWRERNMRPDMTAAEVKAERARFDQYKSLIELARDDVLGRLKTSSPHRWDNQLGRHLREMGQVVRLGKVLKTVMPELARPAMVNGFGNAFRGTFMRWFATLEQIDRNSEFIKLVGEGLDMNLPHAAARLSEMNSADVRRGNPYFNAISKFVPTYFKMNGLTPYTVIAKNISMTIAQHRIMKDAIAIAEALNKGESPDPVLVARNAADGVGLRDNLLLAKMPFEMSGNNLILPATHKWTGSEGRRATKLLLNSLAINSRRTIITPGPSDLPMITRGVFIWKGEKKFESELLGLLFMFKGYGMAATQKLVLSGMQGRDVNAAGGILAMLMLGAFTTYLKTPELAWRNKSYEDILLDSYENAGIGGFLFGDLNGMVETYSAQKLGIRPALGLDPKLASDSDISKYVDMMGPGASVYGSMVQSFLDPELSASNRAQLFRRSLPAANLIYWDRLTRDAASAMAAPFEE